MEEDSTTQPRLSYVAIKSKITDILQQENDVDTICDFLNQVGANSGQQQAILDLCVRELQYAACSSHTTVRTEKLKFICVVLKGLVSASLVSPARLFPLLESFLEQLSTEDAGIVFDMLEQDSEWLVRAASTLAEPNNAIIVRCFNTVLRRLPKNEAAALIGRVKVMNDTLMGFGQHSHRKYPPPRKVSLVEEANRLASTMNGEAPETPYDTKVFDAIWAILDSAHVVGISASKLRSAKASWEGYKSNLDVVLSAFEKIARETGKFDKRAKRAAVLQQAKKEQPLYLHYMTSPKIFAMQLVDPFFQRHVLCETLILLGVVETTPLEPETPKSRNREPDPKEKEAKEAKEKQEKEQFAADMKSLKARIEKLLEQTSYDGVEFKSTLSTIFRREQKWVAWKSSKFASFALPPAAPFTEAPAPVSKRRKMSDDENDLGSASLNGLWNERAPAFNGNVMLDQFASMSDEQDNLITRWQICRARAVLVRPFGNIHKLEPPPAPIVEEPEPIPSKVAEDLMDVDSDVKPELPRESVPSVRETEVPPQMDTSSYIDSAAPGTPEPKRRKSNDDSSAQVQIRPALEHTSSPQPQTQDDGASYGVQPGSSAIETYEGDDNYGEYQEEEYDEYQEEYEQAEAPASSFGAVATQMKMVTIPTRAGRGAEVCKFFGSAQGCRFGDQCNFIHEKATPVAFVGNLRLSDTGLPAELAAFKGRIAELVRNKEQSILIQQMIDTSPSPPFIAALFHELKDHLQSLIVDPFGNYVVQKLLDYGGPTIRDETLRRMLAENPVAISRNPYGTRVLQKIIDVATAEQRIALCSLFASRSSSEIYAMMLDANGNHVIQKLLMLCEPGDHLGFVYRAVEKDFLRIATDNYGCRIAQRCIETAPAKGGYVSQLLVAVIENAEVLIQNQYGNYVVQCVLDKKMLEAIYGIVLNVRAKIYELSRLKYSSPAVETMFKVGNPATVSLLLKELTNMPDSNLVTLLTDQFGNYVCQTAIREAHSKPSTEANNFMARISSLVASIRHLNPRMALVYDKALSTPGLEVQSVHGKGGGKPTSSNTPRDASDRVVGSRAQQHQGRHKQHDRHR